MVEAPKLVLIDGHAMLYRAFFAFPQSLTTKRGELVNAVYGFTRMILTIIEQLEPSHLAVSFDIGETFRHQEFPDYKAHREKMPDELREQEDRAYQVVEALNLPLYIKQGFEADDVIGTVATLAARDEGADVVIVTGDMDILQLVADQLDGGSIRVFRPANGRKTARLYDEAAVLERYGLTPHQIIDYKGLAGDSSDNIPGVRGIGPKTATKLLEHFHTLEGVYQYLDKRSVMDLKDITPHDKEVGLSASIASKLVEQKDQAYLSKHLATIVTNTDIPFTLDDALLKAYDKTKAVQLFEDLEFTSLIKKLPQDEHESNIQEALF